MRDEEFEGVIKDALYTALQAESNYHESAASKMYVEKLVASLPKWWVPAEQTVSSPLRIREKRLEPILHLQICIIQICKCRKLSKIYVINNHGVPNRS
jgi:hypothetical protein